jgi:hypothetical protein
VARVHVAVEIDADVSHVWAAVERIEHHVQWMADAVAIRFDSEQRRGAGTTFVCDTKIGPIRLADRMLITDWEAPAVMGVRHDGLVTGTGRFTLTPIDLGRRTRFAWEETLAFPWWLGGPLGATIAARTVLRRLWQGNLRTLKGLIETDVRTGREPGR